MRARCSVIYVVNWKDMLVAQLSKPLDLFGYAAAICDPSARSFLALAGQHAEAQHRRDQFAPRHAEKSKSLPHAGPAT